MSNYTPAVNLTPKDALVSGDPNKVILGATLQTELNSIASAIATKYDSATSVMQNAVGYKALKTASLGRTNVSSVVADPDLTLTLPVGTYLVRCLLNINVFATGAIPGFLLQLAGSLVTTIIPQFTILDSTPGVATPKYSGTTYPVNASFSPTATGIVPVTLEGMMTVTTAGTLTVSWSQLNSSATSTTLSLGSYLYALRVA